MTVILNHDVSKWVSDLLNLAWPCSEWFMKHSFFYCHFFQGAEETCS